MAPIPKSTNKLLEETLPKTDEELGTEVPVKEQYNKDQLVKPKSKSSDKPSKSKMNHPTHQNTNRSITKTKSTNNNTKNNPSRTTKKTENEDGTEKFVIDKIVNHCINPSRKHAYAE